MKNSIVLILIILAFASCKQPHEKKLSADDTLKKIKNLIDSTATEFIEKPLINSASIGFYYKGEEYIGHYGELEKNKKNLPCNETIYEVGSLSKVLTGTVMAHAVLEGKLNLEDRVDKYLNEEYPNLSFEDYPLRIKHLLTHSSGLPNILPNSLEDLLTIDFLKKDTPSKINSILKEYDKETFLKDLHKISIDTIPGFKYSYSSAGTELAAYILEEVYQDDFEDILVAFLADKIGMTETKIRLNQYEKKNLAVGYHADYPDITVPMQELPWGAGGNIKTTLPDMMKFIKFQLSKSDITEESHKIIVNYGKEVGVAYFWEVSSENEKLGKHYIHHGGVPRSQCYIYIIPKYNLGTFIITNQSGKETTRKMRETLDKIFDGILDHEKKQATTTPKLH